MWALDSNSSFELRLHLFEDVWWYVHTCLSSCFLELDLSNYYSEKRGAIGRYQGFTQVSASKQAIMSFFTTLISSSPMHVNPHQSLIKTQNPECLIITKICIGQWVLLHTVLWYWLNMFYVASGKNSDQVTRSYTKMLAQHHDEFS